MAGRARRQWTTPELTVISRGEPEEAVLGACKSGWDGNLGVDANSVQWKCIQDYACASCVEWQSS